MDHTYEEIRDIALDLLAGRDNASFPPSQYANLMAGIAEVFEKREGRTEDRGQIFSRNIRLSSADSELFLEVFWGLFREGIITLGLNDSNREFPFFRVSRIGKQLLDGKNAYFFHDVSTFTKLIQTEVPNIDSTTLLYLQESMQSFRAGCILAATVMLGVATEHTFLLLIDTIEQNATHASTFASVGQQRAILHKINKFKNILDQQIKNLPSEVREDIDTHFAGVLSIIRNFRNQSGHPTGKIIDREQAYILLQLFIPYCRKMYQLMEFFKQG